MNQTFLNKLTRDDQVMVHVFHCLRANARLLNCELSAVRSLSFPFLVATAPS